MAPSKHKIIRTRDVILDPAEPDLIQLITKPMIEIIFEIPPHFCEVILFIEIDNNEISITD